MKSGKVQMSHELIHFLLLVWEWKKPTKFRDAFDLFFHAAQLVFQAAREN